MNKNIKYKSATQQELNSITTVWLKKS